MARYLVVANVTAESPVLREKARRFMDEDAEAEFVVLVPAQPVAAHLHWMAGLDRDPIRVAGRRGRRARLRLLEIGARVLAVRVGPYDPAAAIEEELRFGSYRGVIVSTMPHRISHWLHRDLPAQVAHRHPGLEVVHAPAPVELYEDPAVPSII